MATLPTNKPRDGALADAETLGDRGLASAIGGQCLDDCDISVRQKAPEVACGPQISRVEVVPNTVNPFEIVRTVVELALVKVVDLWKVQRIGNESPCDQPVNGQVTRLPIAVEVNRQVASVVQDEFSQAASRGVEATALSHLLAWKATNATKVAGFVERLKLNYRNWRPGFGELHPFGFSTAYASDGSGIFNNIQANGGTPCR